MKERITVRLYESPDVEGASPCGRYVADAKAGWDLSEGDTVGLTERAGGRLFGVVESVETETQTDDAGKPYRLAAVWTQD